MLGWLLAAFDAEIVAHARCDVTARRRATMSGVGLITASSIVATVAEIGMFPSARHFAAWLGLVTRQDCTEKIRLERITRTGIREMKWMLVLGATSSAKAATARPASR